MELNDILAVSGKPGLYKLVSKTKNGLIAESLIDQKKLTIFSHEKVSSLDEISMFTTGEDMPLKDVFKKVEEYTQSGKTIEMNVKPDELRKVFLVIVPEFDQERVYNSDIKKILNWYLLLKEKNLLDFSEEPAAADIVEPEKQEGETEPVPGAEEKQ